MLRWHREYGDVVRVRLRNWTLMLNNPSDVRHVLVSHQSSYHKGEAFRVARRVFGRGLLASEEPLHLAQRRLIQPAFHREALQSYAETMTGRALQAAADWSSLGEIDAPEQVMRLTLQIAARTMFGVEDVAETEALARAVDASQDFLFAKQTSPLPLPDWLPTSTNWRYQKAVQVMDRLIYRIIGERRRSSESANDLLSLLLSARDEDGRGMADRQIRDEALTLLLAGHETTANALSWTFYLLSTHPAVEARVIEELEDVLAGRLPGIPDLPRLRYTDMVLSEVLRMYPPAWILPRVAIEDDVLATGTTVPTGQEVVVSPWTTQRDPRFYPNPDRFDPGRFSSENRETRPAYAYFPFGGGNRRCIGEPFAKMEMALVVATVLPRLKMTLVPGQRIEPEPRVTLRPRFGIRMTVSKRPTGPFAVSREDERSPN